MCTTCTLEKNIKIFKSLVKCSGCWLWLESISFQFLNKKKKKKRETQISETRQQVKKKTLVAIRIKGKEEQIEANLNEDQRRVASQQRRMLKK